MLSIAPDGIIQIFVAPMDDHSQTFFDAVDIAKDGTIWLSDATTCFAYHDSLYNFIEESATGRLLSYTPATGK